MFAVRIRQVPVIAWVVAVLVVLAGVIALSGGFKTASASWKGVETEAGTVVHTRFWDIAVYEAQVTQGGEIEVATQLGYKLSQAGYVDRYLLVAHIPDQSLTMTGATCYTHNNRPFNPEVVVTAVCSFRAPEDRELDLEGLTEVDIEVIVFDQRFDDSLLEGQRPASDRPIAYYPLTAPVLEW